MRIRLERELTDARLLGPSLEAFLAADHAALYAGPIASWLRTAAPVIVSQPGDVLARIVALADAHKITPAKAISLMGTVSALLHAPQILGEGDRRTYRLRDLRAFGLHVDVAGGPSAESDAVTALRALIEAWETAA